MLLHKSSTGGVGVPTCLGVSGPGFMAVWGGSWRPYITGQTETTQSGNTRNLNTPLTHSQGVTRRLYSGVEWSAYPAIVELMKFMMISLEIHLTISRHRWLGNRTVFIQGQLDTANWSPHKHLESQKWILWTWRKDVGIAWNPEYSNKAADPTDPRRTSQFIPSRSQTAYGFGRSDKLCQILSQNGKFHFNFGKTSLELKRISDRISDVF